MLFNMPKKIFNISELISDDFINEKVAALGEKRLTPTSHNFNHYGAITIIDAANASHQNYNNQAKNLPAIALIEVVLAANRNYNKVVLPNVVRLKKEHAHLVSFNDLNRLLSSKTKEEFFKIWGHKDDKKYQILLNILQEINTLKKDNPNKSDYEVMNNWANTIDINVYNNEVIGRIRNIALATLQHLRMTFGANTVKPDQRVIEVLEYEFNLKGISQMKSILAVEQISKITRKPALLIDQIFVLYGSGYYNRNGSTQFSISQNTIVKEIAKKLKDFKIDPQIISKSTNLSLQEISDL